jgi:hypothetical protein
MNRAGNSPGQLSAYTVGWVRRPLVSHGTPLTGPTRNSQRVKYTGRVGKVGLGWIGRYEFDGTFDSNIAFDANIAFDSNITFDSHIH